MPVKQFLEAGKIVSTHGIAGAVRIQPWCDSADFLCRFDRLFIDEREFTVLSSSVHKTLVLCQFDGVNDIPSAAALRNKTVYINRDDVSLEDGVNFIQDLIGLDVYDKNLGYIGRVSDVLTPPASNVYIVDGDKRCMIPAVDEFIKAVDIKNGRIDVEIIEGMFDEN